MIFSVPNKPKSIHLQKKETQYVNQHTSTQKSVNIQPFLNIFSRLQTSGSCKSCG